MANKKDRIIIDGFNIRTSEPPPEGFDPLTAEQSKLRYHGIPRRPNRDKESEWYKKWQSIYSRKLHYIVPEFAKDEHLRHPGNTKAKVTDHSYWSGAEADAPIFQGVTGQFQWISGNWIVQDPNSPSVQ